MEIKDLESTFTLKYDEFEDNSQKCLEFDLKFTNEVRHGAFAYSVKVRRRDSAGWSIHSKELKSVLRKAKLRSEHYLTAWPVTHAFLKASNNSSQLALVICTSDDDNPIRVGIDILNSTWQEIRSYLVQNNVCNNDLPTLDFRLGQNFYFQNRLWTAAHITVDSYDKGTIRINPQQFCSTDKLEFYGGELEKLVGHDVRIQTNIKTVTVRIENVCELLNGNFVINYSGDKNQVRKYWGLLQEGDGKSPQIETVNIGNENKAVGGEDMEMKLDVTDLIQLKALSEVLKDGKLTNENLFKLKFIMDMNGGRISDMAKVKIMSTLFTEKEEEMSIEKLMLFKQLNEGHLDPMELIQYRMTEQMVGGLGDFLK